MNKNGFKQKFPPNPLRWALKNDIENLANVIFEFFRDMD